MKHILLITAGAVLLTGCVVHPPSIEVPSVQVPVVHVERPVRVITPPPVYQYRYYDNDHHHKKHHGKHKHKHGD